MSRERGILHTLDIGEFVIIVIILLLSVLGYYYLGSRIEKQDVAIAVVMKWHENQERNTIALSELRNQLNEISQQIARLQKTFRH